MKLHIARTTFLLAAFTGFMLALGGCAETHGGRVFTNDNWNQQKNSLGKVALYVSGKDNGELAKDHATQVNAIVAKAIANYPNSQILPPTDEQKAAYGKSLSDADALAFGKKSGADTVCVMTVADYGGVFFIGMGIPYLAEWDCETRAMYSLRLLDVKTGELLLECASYRKSGGRFGFWDCTDPQKNLRIKLESDLKP